MHAIAGTSISPTMLTTINAPRYGTVIPNRIFVGGIDFKTSEDDLQNFFQEFGTVRDTKIIRDRADVSKGYGFVTFNSSDEAMKVQDQGDYLYLKGKKLNIAPAVRKQPNIHITGPPDSWVLHPSGYASLATSNGTTYYQPVAIGPQVGIPNQNTQYVMSYNAPQVPAITQQIVSPGGQYTTYPAGVISQTIPQTYAMPCQWNSTSVPPGACGQLVSPAPQPQEQIPHGQNLVQATHMESYSPSVATVRPGEHSCSQQSSMTKIGQVVAASMSPCQVPIQPTYAQVPNHSISVRHSVFQENPPQMCSPGRHPSHFSTVQAAANGQEVLPIHGSGMQYCYQASYPAGPYNNGYENQSTSPTVRELHEETASPMPTSSQA